MPKIPLINDSNYKEFTSDTGVVDFNGPRYLSLMKRRTTYGDKIACRGRPSIIVARPMREDELIPRSEWPDRIRKKDLEKSWLEDLTRGRVPCGDQGPTNYCHAFGTVQAMMDQRCVQNHPFVRLSSMSIGGPITGWRNKGAYPEDDLDQAVEFGACPYSFQDSEYSMSPSRWGDGWEATRQDYQIDEFLDGLLPGGKAFDAAVTMAMKNIPSAPGFQWWSHLTSGGYRVIDLGRNRFSIRNRNNWGADYGDDGYYDLQEGKGTPDITLFGAGLVGATG